MSKTKLIFYVTLVVGVLLFVMESATYMLFGAEFKRFLGKLIGINSKFMFGLKLLGIDMLIGLFIAMIYDTIHKSLPGGFLRKGINFAFLLWGLQTMPLLLHVYIAAPPGILNRIFMIVLMQYLVINLIVAFVVTGLYDEFYLKSKKEAAPGEEEDKIEIKKTRKTKKEKEEEKSDEPETDKTADTDGSSGSSN